jgi:hypothetical protein
MSVTVMAMVWDTDLPKNMKLALLAYADHANDAGSSIYPGEKIMAQKTSDSPGNVRRVTATLVNDGVLVRVKRGHVGRRAQYRIDLDRLRSHIPVLEPSERVAPVRATDDPERRASTPPSQPERRTSTSREACTGATPNHQEPSGIYSVETTNQTQHGDVFDALIEVSGWNPTELSKDETGRTREAAKNITDLGGNATDVQTRGIRFREINRSDYPLKPWLLAGQWAACAPPIETACSHRKLDGSSAMSSSMVDGVDLVRCDICYAREAVPV